MNNKQYNSAILDRLLKNKIWTAVTYACSVCQCDQEKGTKIIDGIIREHTGKKSPFHWKASGEGDDVVWEWQKDDEEQLRQMLAVNMKPKLRKFYFHYNKPQSKQKGYPVISIHYNKTCHFAKNVIINTPTRGKIRKHQPLFVIEGYFSNIIWDDKKEIATIE